MNKKSQALIIGIVLIVIFALAWFLFFNKPAEALNKQTINKDVQLTGETKEFEITVKNWKFNPSVIEVNKGDKVELHLETIEGYHGFALPEFGINERLDEGTDVHVEFIADKKGVFNFFCNIPCGQGHGGMNGQLIVK